MITILADENHLWVKSFAKNFSEKGWTILWVGGKHEKYSEIPPLMTRPDTRIYEWCVRNSAMILTDNENDFLAIDRATQRDQRAVIILARDKFHYEIDLFIQCLEKALSEKLHLDPNNRIIRLGKIRNTFFSKSVRREQGK